jgi:hypothetical protein
VTAPLTPARVTTISLGRVRYFSLRAVADARSAHAHKEILFSHILLIKYSYVRQDPSSERAIVVFVPFADLLFLEIILVRYPSV